MMSLEEFQQQYPDLWAQVQVWLSQAYPNVVVTALLVAKMMAIEAHALSVSRAGADPSYIARLTDLAKKLGFENGSDLDPGIWRPKDIP